MGLDMYVEKVSGGLITQPVDFTFPDRTEPVEVHYWRKHPNLHGWMEQLYREKGGQDPSFNLNRVQITEADLDRLEIDINNSDLPETYGLFFGSSQPEDKVDDLRFIKTARQELKAGNDLYYTSWW